MKNITFIWIHDLYDIVINYYFIGELLLKIIILTIYLCFWIVEKKKIKIKIKI